MKQRPIHKGMAHPAIMGIIGSKIMQYEKVENLQQGHHHDHWPLTIASLVYLLLARAHLLGHEERRITEKIAIRCRNNDTFKPTYTNTSAISRLFKENIKQQDL